MRSAVRTSRSSLRARAGIVLDQVIELRAVAQHAEDDFGGQPGVARIECRGVGEQEVGGVAARFHFAQNVERQQPGGGDLRMVFRWHFQAGRLHPGDGSMCAQAIVPKRFGKCDEGLYTWTDLMRKYSKLLLALTLFFTTIVIAPSGMAQCVSLTSIGTHTRRISIPSRIRRVARPTP